MKKFVWFLFSLNVYCGIIAGYSIYKIVDSKISGSPWIYNDYITLVVIFFAVNTFISLLVMLIQAIYLISKNKTTNENIRGTKYPNDIFNEGCKKNWKSFLNEK